VNDGDALTRARQALQATRPRADEEREPLPDASAVNALLARAREAAESRPRHQAVPTARPPAVVPAGPARLVFAVDATGSRETAWETAKKLTDTLIGALPGQLEISLAVHGDGRVHTFTDFGLSARKLRKVAAGVRCETGGARLLEILARVLECERVRVVVYIGDSFEEDEAEGMRLAEQLGARGIRLIILHDAADRDYTNYGRAAAEIFGEMARRTGGAVLPFDRSAVRRLRELLAAVVVLAVGGPSMLAARQSRMPAARTLLLHISSEDGSPSS
jgi:hypothetical protein